VLFLAKDLLGKVLYTQVDGQITAGIIVETEAYFGEIDKPLTLMAADARTEPKSCTVKAEFRMCIYVTEFIIFLIL
jgi:3-methyladenine DNA glycosylase Mpg